MFVFITPVLDLMVLSWVLKLGQTRLTAAQFYFVRSVKFVLILAMMGLTMYARVWRQDLTENFTKCPYEAKSVKEGVDQPLLG